MYRNAIVMRLKLNNELLLQLQLSKPTYLMATKAQSIVCTAQSNRQTERQIDRQTDREKERGREGDRVRNNNNGKYSIGVCAINNALSAFTILKRHSEEF